MLRSKKIEVWKLERMIRSQGTILDDEMHSDLTSIMEVNTKQVLTEFQPDSFQRIFWEERARLSSARNMRWHPMMIKWCLYVKHLSSGTYEALKRTRAGNVLFVFPYKTVPSHI